MKLLLWTYKTPFIVFEQQYPCSLAVFILVKLVVLLFKPEGVTLLFQGPLSSYSKTSSWTERTEIFLQIHSLL